MQRVIYQECGVRPVFLQCATLRADFAACEIYRLVKLGVVRFLRRRRYTYPERRNHNFRPGGPADVDLRARTRKWLDTHVK